MLDPSPGEPGLNLPRFRAGKTLVHCPTPYLPIQKLLLKLQLKVTGSRSCRMSSFVAGFLPCHFPFCKHAKTLLLEKYLQCVLKLYAEILSYLNSNVYIFDAPMQETRP